MRLSLAVSELVLASWKVDPEAVERAVFPGLEPIPIGDDHVVSLVALRIAGGRLAGIPVPPFTQLNARTYVRFEGAPAGFFLRSYVSLAGLGGAVFGVPLRAARIRLRHGRVDAPGPGFSLAYELAGRAEPGELGTHEVGLYEAAGLRSFRVRRGPAEWEGAHPTGDVRADVLPALGFTVGARPDHLFYARGLSFELDVPVSRVSDPRSSASRSRR